VFETKAPGNRLLAEAMDSEVTDVSASIPAFGPLVANVLVPEFMVLSFGLSLRAPNRVPDEAIATAVFPLEFDAAPTLRIPVKTPAPTGASTRGADWFCLEGDSVDGEIELLLTDETTPCSALMLTAAFDIAFSPLVGEPAKRLPPAVELPVEISPTTDKEGVAEGPVCALTTDTFGVADDNEASPDAPVDAPADPPADAPVVVSRALLLLCDEVVGALVSGSKVTGADSGPDPPSEPDPGGGPLAASPFKAMSLFAFGVDAGMAASAFPFATINSTALSDPVAPMATCSRVLKDLLVIGAVDGLAAAGFVSGRGGAKLCGGNTGRSGVTTGELCASGVKAASPAPISKAPPWLVTAIRPSVTKASRPARVPGAQIGSHTVSTKVKTVPRIPIVAVGV
jgi:hypothetical protein